MKHTISCRTSVYGKPMEAATRLPDAGITHAELSSAKPEALAGINAELNGVGVQIASVGADVNLSKEDNVRAYAALIDAMGAVGIPRLFSSIKREEAESPADAYRVLTDLAQRAEGCGVIICMETHPPFGHNSVEALKTVKEVGSKGLRLNFDTANIYYYNEHVNASADGVDELSKVSEYVASVHLKDTDGGFHSMNFPVLGEGIVDFPSTFALLDKAGFTGPYTMELEGPLTSKKTLDERHGAVKASMAHLRSIGAV